MATHAKEKHVEDKFKNSVMFGQFFNEVMETEKTLRGNTWNLDVLISNCNQLIDKYIKSPFTQLDKFFRSFVESKHKKKDTMHGYIVVFFLSLEHWAAEDFETDALRRLFNKQASKRLIEQWWHIRDNILLINNLTPSTSMILSNVFMTRSEIKVLVDRVRSSQSGYKEMEDWITTKEENIKDLRKDVRNGKQLAKAKLDRLEKFFKVGKTSAAPVSFRLLQHYIEKEEVDLLVI